MKTMELNDKIKDLTGLRFGRLVAIDKIINKKGKPSWLCKCDCGKEAIIERTRLINNKTKSCGCVHTHGHAHENIYKVYYAMLKRCKNPKDKSYKNYGGRGISVCQEWQNDFMNFYNWSMDNGYKEGLTLDRENNNGDYGPNNCRWVDSFVQAKNRRVEKISTTGISGVQERKDKGDYRVVITSNGKRYSLGCYKNFKDAKEARKQGELKYWGFTRIND